MLPSQNTSILVGRISHTEISHKVFTKRDVEDLPVATLFAFTQLRASMPGAPEGFGDILGKWVSEATGDFDVIQMLLVTMIVKRGVALQPQ